MKIRTNFSLQALNSLNLPAVTAEILYPSSIKDLAEITRDKAISSYVLGEGTNTLFCQSKAPTIIKPSLLGITINESDENYRVSVACAENWHNFVVYCISNGIYGLENLALIPGSVGAAPVQNIGAYGIEVGGFIERISWFDFNKQSLVEFTNADCQFGYRDSIFKKALKGMGVITHVHFLLPKAWQAVNSYQGLNELAAPVTPQSIMAQVIELRQAKLPDPKHLPNAGSFFKNPIVTEDFFTILQQHYPAMPFYRQGNGEIKLAAGWLIEQAGLKGFRQGGVGVHEKQALVIINYSSSLGQEIVEFSVFIQQAIMNKFNIHLVPEVQFINDDEQSFITGSGVINESHS